METNARSDSIAFVNPEGVDPDGSSPLGTYAYVAGDPAAEDAAIESFIGDGDGPGSAWQLDGDDDDFLGLRGPASPGLGNSGNDDLRLPERDSHDSPTIVAPPGAPGEAASAGAAYSGPVMAQGPSDTSNWDFLLRTAVQHLAVNGGELLKVDIQATPKLATDIRTLQTKFDGNATLYTEREKHTTKTHFCSLHNYVNRAWKSNDDETTRDERDFMNATARWMKGLVLYSKGEHAAMIKSHLNGIDKMAVANGGKRFGFEGFAAQHFNDPDALNTAVMKVLETLPNGWIGLYQKIATRQRTDYTPFDPTSPGFNWSRTGAMWLDVWRCTRLIVNKADAQRAKGHKRSKDAATSDAKRPRDAR